MLGRVRLATHARAAVLATRRRSQSCFSRPTKHAPARGALSRLLQSEATFWGVRRLGALAYTGTRGRFLLPFPCPSRGAPGRQASPARSYRRTRGHDAQEAFRRGGGGPLRRNPSPESQARRAIGAGQVGRRSSRATAITRAGTLFASRPACMVPMPAIPLSGFSVATGAPADGDGACGMCACLCPTALMRLVRPRQQARSLACPPAPLGTG